MQSIANRLAHSVIGYAVAGVRSVAPSANSSVYPPVYLLLRNATPLP